MSFSMSFSSHLPAPMPVRRLDAGDATTRISGAFVAIAAPITFLARFAWLVPASTGKQPTPTQGREANNCQVTASPGQHGAAWLRRSHVTSVPGTQQPADVAVEAVSKAREMVCARTG